MNQLDYPPYEPPAVPPVQPKRSVKRGWLLGCSCVLFCMVLALGTCALAIKGGLAVGEQAFGPMSDKYLAQVAARDYHAAYVDFDPEFRAATTEAEYVKLEDGIHQRTGALRSKSFSSVNETINGKGTWATVVYACEFDTGPGTLRITFHKSPAGWKIAGCHYDSTKIEESLRSTLETSPDASTGEAK